MIPELLHEIVAKGESLNVEFKGEEKAALSDSAAGRSSHMPCQPNTYRVSALIANRTRSSLACRVEIVEMDGLTVLAVEVPTSRTPVSIPEGKYQRRR